MKTSKRIHSRFVYGIPVVVIVLGVVLTGWLCRCSDLSRYPAMVAEAYHEDQNILIVPGSRVVQLTRKGAYGIYIETSKGSTSERDAEMTPAMDCYLTSDSTGQKIKAVPDYVATNRYWTRELDKTWVLVMSITADSPGTYDFTCSYSGGEMEPAIRVALGPNYFWEFLKVAWDLVLPLFGGFIALCGSFLYAMIIGVVIWILRRSL